MASRFRLSRSCSPNTLSDTGPSMPAATRLALSASLPGSTSVTLSPLQAARQAMAVPITPPPAITTSASTLSPFAGITRIRFDGRRLGCLPLSPARAPVGSRQFNPPSSHARQADQWHIHPGLPRGDGLDREAGTLDPRVVGVCHLPDHGGLVIAEI